MTTQFTRLFCGFTAALSLGLATSNVHAGDIVGSIMDTDSNAALPGASITVLEGGRKGTADNGGHYRISGLSAGTYTVRVNYVGYDSKTETVAVPATGEAVLNIAMGDKDVVKLEKFVVEGYREGRSRAMQQKQNAANIMDLVSADAIGNLPDRNVAEAVARLPGVNLSLDQGEGQYVSIRGAEPNLNQVMMDGATMAAPGGSRLGRAVPLDTLGSGQISSIEVIKSVRPDMDANAVGGTINIKSASAFDQDGRRVTGSLSGNRNGAVSKTDAAGQLFYSDRFGPNKAWGIAASLSYDKRNYQNEWLQFDWTPITLNGAATYLPSTFQIKPEWGNKERDGATLNLEYRPDADTLFYVRPGYSHTKNPETRFEVIYSPTVAPANVIMSSPTAGTFTRNRTERRSFSYQNDQSLFNVAAGFKKVYGSFTVEPMLTFSKAKSKNPYNHTREFRNANGATGDIKFDLGTGFVPIFWQADPAVDVPSKYPLRRTRDDYGIQDEKIRSAKVDVTWEFPDSFGVRGNVKSGAKFLHRSRVVDLESRRLVPVGNWNLGQTGDQLPSVKVYNDRFDSLFLPNAVAIDKFISANPSLVTHDLVGESTNSIEDDYAIEEYIYAGYLMSKVDIDKLTLLGGLRWEKTDATIRAVQEVTVGRGNPVQIPNSGVTSYDKFFPNVQGVYHFTDQLQLRAAITQTIGRPAYEDSRTLAIFNYSSILSPVDPTYGNSGSVTVGNPKLKPYGAKSYDLSLEWYARKGGGVVSIAAFRKDIADPIYSYSETQRNVIYSGVGLESLTYNSKLNGTSGRISGVEFSIYQPFHFLPSPFDGFGIEANYTTISSSEVIPTRPGEDIPFFRQPDKIANFTIFYEKYGFSGRVAYTYAGEQIYTLGGSLINDRYETARGQVDVLLRYRVNDHYSITASVRNLTREPDEMSYGIKSLVQSSRLLDRDYKVGVEFNF
ncbi:MAG: TonB-dependent receptor [Opitutaceae bacterium]|nr:TonB-dependent receptor [Opitutaceae bacterium]